jgi:hypothetical protein
LRLRRRFTGPVDNQIDDAAVAYRARIKPPDISSPDDVPAPAHRSCRSRQCDPSR